MENAALRNMKVFEQYENLERAGMAPSIAQAIRDFVLVTLQDMVSLVDWREYKAERASELEKFEANQDRKFDQIRHEAKQTRQELKSDIQQVRQEIKETRQELKSDIQQVRHEIKEIRQELKSDIEETRNGLDQKMNKLKFELVQWMIGLFFAQAGLNAAIVMGMKIFGH